MQPLNQVSPEEVEKQNALEANREYQREYRKAHPEKCKEWAHNYWIRRGRKLAEERAKAEKRNRKRR